MLGDYKDALQRLTYTTAIERETTAQPRNGAQPTNRGAAMVEYALLLVLVLLAAFFSVQVFGESLVALFDASGSTLENAPNVNPAG